MLHKNTRAHLNSHVKLVNFRSSSLDQWQAQQDRAGTWDEKKWVSSIDRLNDACDDLTTSVDDVWIRNLDKGVQQSLNRILKKAGLPTREVTAIM